MTVEITVRLVFSGGPRQVTEQVLSLEAGCTVAQALAVSGHFKDSPDGTAVVQGQGVWGKRVALTHVLQDQDRLEVYRALRVDPKVARRERFVRQGAKKKAAGLFAQRRAGAKAGY